MHYTANKRLLFWLAGAFASEDSRQNNRFCDRVAPWFFV